MKKIFIALMIAFSAMSSFSASISDLKTNAISLDLSSCPQTISGDFNSDATTLLSKIMYKCYRLNIDNTNQQFEFKATCSDENMSVDIVKNVEDEKSIASLDSTFQVVSFDSVGYYYIMIGPTKIASTSYSIDIKKTLSKVSDLMICPYSIIASNGTIRIAGTQARATIYSIGGAKVYEGADREIALPSGIYVVRIGEMAKKVIVK